MIKTGRSSSSMLEQHVNIATNHPQSFSSSHRTSWSTQLHAQLGNFLASVVRSRSFYGTLADNICEEYPDERCWNGERVGEWVSFFLFILFYFDLFTLTQFILFSPPSVISNISAFITCISDSRETYRKCLWKSDEKIFQRFWFDIYVWSK